MNSGTRIQDMPANERPRERLAQFGAKKLHRDELLAILLRTGTRGQSALDLARALMKQFPKLGILAEVPLDELCQVPGVGRDKAITLQAALELASRVAHELREEAPLLDTPERVADYVRGAQENTGREQLHLVLLNVRRRLIRIEKLAEGTRDTLLVDPADVFRRAILANAAAIVLAHNHPTGDPSPSESDIKTTRDLIRIGQLLQIEVLDHVIVGHKTSTRPAGYLSLRELGYFYR